MSGGNIKGLNGLRALCALFILWGHMAQYDFCQWEITPIPVPECCAYVFFAISGLLAGYRIDQTEGLRSYYRKKARRLLPLYVAYLSVAVLLFSVFGQVKEVLNLRLLYYIFLIPQIPFCTNSGILPLVHLWFIGVLVLFYVLFPLFARLGKEKRKMAAVVIAIAWILLKLVLRAFMGTDTVLYRLVGVTCFDVLFAGVWVGLLLKEGHPFIEKMKGWTILGLSAGLLFLCSGLYGRWIPAPVRVDFIALITLAFIVTLQKGSFSSFLGSRFLDRIGMISYEVYVTQILVIISLSWLYVRAGITFPSFFIYFISTVVVLGVAWCFHQALRLCCEDRSRQTDR